MAIPAEKLIHQPDQAGIQDLLDVVLRGNPGMDTASIERAYTYADDAHHGELRKSGEPSIIHPLRVAIILAGMQLDPETLATEAIAADISERAKHLYAFG